MRFKAARPGFINPPNGLVMTASSVFLAAACTWGAGGDPVTLWAHHEENLARLGCLGWR